MFLSLNDWLEIEFEQYPHNALIEQVSNAAKLAAIGTWRYSQGIYQINEDLFTALIASPISSILPSEVFTGSLNGASTLKYQNHNGWENLFLGSGHTWSGTKKQSALN